MAIIELEQVSYTYPLTEEAALQQVDLKVEDGQFVAVVGPNGSGKSTLCFTIAGFIPHFFQGELTGRVQVAGKVLHESTLSEYVLQVGLVFQNPFNQISGAKFTVFEEIAFGLENLGVPRAEMVTRVETVLDLTGIRDLAERSPYALSGGQQQRVALASILVMRPQVLVLDEPTSQLDPIGSRQVFQSIKALSAEGITVVMASHKVEWIAEFADHVIALNAGRIIAQGSAQQVLTDDQVQQSGAGLSRYTLAARQAREEGLWAIDRPLPVTLDQALRGFSEDQHAD